MFVTESFTCINYICVFCFFFKKNNKIYIPIKRQLDTYIKRNFSQNKETIDGKPYVERFEVLYLFT